MIYDMMHIYAYVTLFTTCLCWCRVNQDRLVSISQLCVLCYQYFQQVNLFFFKSYRDSTRKTAGGWATKPKQKTCAQELSVRFPGRWHPAQLFPERKTTQQFVGIVSVVFFLGVPTFLSISVASDFHVPQFSHWLVALLSRSQSQFIGQLHCAANFSGFFYCKEVKLKTCKFMSWYELIINIQINYVSIIQRWPLRFKPAVCGWRNMWEWQDATWHRLNSNLAESPPNPGFR